MLSTDRSEYFLHPFAFHIMLARCIQLPSLCWTFFLLSSFANFVSCFRVTTAISILALSSLNRNKLVCNLYHSVLCPPGWIYTKRYNYMSMTASRSAIKTTMRMMMHHPLPFSSESRMNVHILRIASFSFESVWSTPCSRSSSNLVKSQSCFGRGRRRVFTRCVPRFLAP